MSSTMSFPTGHEVASSSSLESPQLCTQFTISEILEATKHFNESLVVGRGGFGKVYKATIVNGASLLNVAIKRLDSTSNQGALEFWAEVKMLSKLRHDHLVSLIGYCNDEPEMILVYEYMPRGTLEDHLHKRGTSLPWLQRLKICVGAARGLDYLHTGTGIEHGVIHRDVKSSNILLHYNWSAKISDFGLSKICPIDRSSTGVSTFVKGTFGYLDPHYFQMGKLTKKSDVYSFGVVLLEVLCGKQALDTSFEWGLAAWAQESIRKGKQEQIVDVSLKEIISPKCLKRFARLADQCLHSNPMERPTMAEVVAALESFLAILQPVGMALFGRKVPKLGSVGDLKPLKNYLYTVSAKNPMFRQYDFGTLNYATGNFSRDRVFLQHGFGDMYKGMLRDGQIIAVVRTAVDFTNEIMNEVLPLVKHQHRNLFLALGYCIYRTEVFIVYEYPPNGTLKSLLADPMLTCGIDHLPFSWRVKSLHEVAEGLRYLHNKVPIKVIHGNLTPMNILFDDRLKPKLSDFRFATHLIHGTECNVSHRAMEYMAPEYIDRGYLSCKTDVFSFGVVLLETMSGIGTWRAIEGTNKFELLHKYALRSWLEGTSFQIDPEIGVDSSLMTRFVEIGLLCIQPDVANRPTMEHVVKMLHDDLSPTLLLSIIRERTLSKIQKKGVIRELK